MITEYHRPDTLYDALTLLARKEPVSYPLGGGTVLNRANDGDYAVVDLQNLGMDTVAAKGNQLLIGATVTLQELLNIESLPDEFTKVIELEATYNLRQIGTIAGTLVSSDGRSPLATALLACDTNIEVHELDIKAVQIKLGDWLPMRGEFGTGKLITSVNVPTQIRFSFEYIARTPADRPIVSAAVAQWPSGRARLALGGWGKYPLLGMDGPSSDGIETAGRNAYSLAVDEWASAEYRREMAAVLALRCLNRGK